VTDTRLMDGRQMQMVEHSLLASTDEIYHVLDWDLTSMLLATCPKRKS
jgi:hypothetical protein